MNTQAYLVVVMSFILMITNLLGAAFTISRLRSKWARVTREPTGTSHGRQSPGENLNAPASIFVRVGAFHLAAQGMAIGMGLGVLGVSLLALFAALKIL
jgi:hypothetical protein